MILKECEESSLVILQNLQGVVYFRGESFGVGSEEGETLLVLEGVEGARVSAIDGDLDSVEYTEQKGVVDGGERRGQISRWDQDAVDVGMQDVLPQSRVTDRSVHCLIQNGDIPILVGPSKNLRPIALQLNEGLIGEQCSANSNIGVNGG